MIGHLDLTSEEYAAFIRSPFVDDDIAGADPILLLVVRGDGPIVSPGSLPVVVCSVGAEFGGAGPTEADLVVDEHDIPSVIEAVERAPIAARTLAVLLRSIDADATEAGLAMESAAYSVLQAGPEFEAWQLGWRATHGHASSGLDEPVVIVDRDDDALIITLDRAHRHNSISRRLRDELHAALGLGVTDDSISSVVLRGNGPSFCSGGDLSEFGTRPDPATAHVTRLARSPGRLIDRMRSKTSVFIHGATLGGGIEMAAFAGRVVADPATLIGLPEIGLGLIPGAGGTVSVTRRIGRQRTAALALTGRQISADLARAWGLVDEIGS